MSVVPPLLGCFFNQKSHDDASRENCQPHSFGYGPKAIPFALITVATPAQATWSFRSPCGSEVHSVSLYGQVFT
jgi:hypothetical protein